MEPEEGKYSEEHLERYGRAKEIMTEVGLDEPTIILSNPPDWAKELYGKDKEKFYDEFKRYAEKVRDRLEASKGPKVSRIQILNELNSAIYTPVKVEDLPKVCEITREVFRDYNPDIKLMGTVIAANTVKLTGTPIEQYLPELKKIKDSFDVIAVDYYPGLWHLPIGGAPSKRPGEIFKHVVKQQDLLKKTMEEIATWGKEYELGEVGLPTKKLWGGEKGQRYFFDAFFRAFKGTLVDFRTRGLKLPSHVGIYEAIDEPPRNLMGKLLRKIPFPEHDMGMRKASGKRKSILQDASRSPEEKRTENKSQMNAIIDYMRAPMTRNEKDGFPKVD